MVNKTTLHEAGQATRKRPTGVPGNGIESQLSGATIYFAMREAFK
jgi:hypothetical protein